MCVREWVRAHVSACAHAVCVYVLLSPLTANAKQQRQRPRVGQAAASPTHLLDVHEVESACPGGSHQLVRQEGWHTDAGQGACVQGLLGGWPAGAWGPGMRKSSCVKVKSYTPPSRLP